MTAMSAAEIEGDGYAEGYDDGYEQGWTEATAWSAGKEDAAFELGYAQGLVERSLGEALREQAREEGVDLLEGASVRWDAAERRLVIEPLSRLEAGS